MSNTMTDLEIIQRAEEMAAGQAQPALGWVPKIKGSTKKRDWKLYQVWEELDDGTILIWCQRGGHWWPCIVDKSSIWDWEGTVHLARSHAGKAFVPALNVRPPRNPRNGGPSLKGIHQLIWPTCPVGMLVDHIDGHTLISTKAETRVLTRSENIKNRHPEIWASPCVQAEIRGAA